MDYYWTINCWLLVLLAVSGASSIQNKFFARSISKHEKLVIFSFDGFRYDYMNKTSTPVLDYLKQNGVTTQYMIPQFTTKTFPNHQSFVTGLHTETHGITDNALWDPHHDQYLSGYVDDYNFWNFHDDAVPLWVLNEWAGDGRISGAQFPGSTQPYGKNRTVITHTLSYNKSRPFEERMDIVLNWLTNDTHPANLVFMYFDEPDGVGHAYGPNSPQVIEAIQKLDNTTRYFMNGLKKLGIWDEVNLIFWSDHGMEEVSLSNVINITEIVDPALYNKTGASPVVHIWPNNEELTEEIYQKFTKASESQEFFVYKKKDMPTNWHFGDNRRIGPIVLVSNPGFIFNDRNTKKHHFSISANDTKVGYHGYDNNSTNMRPFFIAYGPAFKKNFEVEPFENIDLFPLVCNMMGINPPRNNGTLERVSPILKSSSSSTFYFYTKFVTAAFLLRFFLLL